MPITNESSNSYLDYQAIDGVGNLQIDRPRSFFDVVTYIDNKTPTAALYAPVDGADVLLPVTLNGSGTDDRALGNVQFRIRDRDRASAVGYLQPDGTWGSAIWHIVPVTTLGTTASDFSWLTPLVDEGSFYVDYQAIDGVGNVQSDLPRGFLTSYSILTM